MFVAAAAPRLFFPPSYFPDLAVVILPADLAAAIARRLERALVAPGLATWCGAGPAAESTPLPYCDLRDPSESTMPLDRATTLATGQVELSSYAKSRGDARALGDLAEAAIRAAPLRFAAGRLMSLRRTLRNLAKDRDDAPEGGDCWREMRIYEYRYSYA